MKRSNFRAILVISVTLLSCVSIFIGAIDVSLSGLLSGDENMIHTLFYSRLPRTLSILLVASSLGISGLIMQKISSNRFVSPQTAITQDATRFGVLISLVLNLNYILKILVSVSIAFIASIGFFKVIGKIRVKDPIIMPLLGIVIGSMIEAFTNLIAQRSDLVQPLNGIFSKGFTLVFTGGYEILYFNIFALVVAYIYFKKFIIISLNESTATNLGISIRSVVNVGLVLISIMTTFVSLSVGSIPFIGLLIPNLISILFDDSSKGYFGDTLLLSSVYLLLCDIIARIVIYPYEVPISLVSGVIGAFMFLFILMRSRYEK